MSKDDIIKNWKGAKEQPKNEPTPPSPVGNTELPDEVLEQVAGGFLCTTPPECPDDTWPPPTGPLP
jgi:mersacidin/lichenicidin family type 2 lantibiotic